jgi:hypothetical protein
MYVIQYCIICRLSDSSVSEEAGIEKYQMQQHRQILPNLKINKPGTFKIKNFSTNCKMSIGGQCQNADAEQLNTSGNNDAALFPTFLHLLIIFLHHIEVTPSASVC